MCIRDRLSYFCLVRIRVDQRCYLLRNRLDILDSHCLRLSSTSAEFSMKSFFSGHQDKMFRDHIHRETYESVQFCIIVSYYYYSPPRPQPWGRWLWNFLTSEDSLLLTRYLLPPFILSIYSCLDLPFPLHPSVISCRSGRRTSMNGVPGDQPNRFSFPQWY